MRVGYLADLVYVAELVFGAGSLAIEEQGVLVLLRKDEEFKLVDGAVFHWIPGGQDISAAMLCVCLLRVGKLCVALLRPFSSCSPLMRLLQRHVHARTPSCC